MVPRSGLVPVPLADYLYLKGVGLIVVIDPMR
jgi:hypothetical protein